MMRAAASLAVILLIATPASAKPAPATGMNNDPGITTFFFSNAPVYDARHSDKIAEFDAIVRAQGGQTNDLAWGAVTAFSIAVAIAGTVRMTPQQVKGSVPLARELLLASANFRAAPDGDKKQVYEMIAAHAIALKRGWDDIAKDRLACGDYVNHAVERCKARDQLHDMAAAAIVRMIEPYALEDFMMTADGMVRKK